MNTAGSNQIVIEAWRKGKKARNHKNTLHTAAGDLWSYDLKIGHRTKSGVCVVADYTATTNNFASKTTSCHVNLAKIFADMVMHPLVSRTSPLFIENEVPF